MSSLIRRILRGRNGLGASAPRTKNDAQYEAKLAAADRENHDLKNKIENICSRVAGLDPNEELAGKRWVLDNRHGCSQSDTLKAAKSLARALVLKGKTFDYWMTPFGSNEAQVFASELSRLVLQLDDGEVK